jgi:hypothetical protein
MGLSTGLSPLVETYKLVIHEHVKLDDGNSMIGTR